jgi:hypothetical protein
MFSSWIWHLTHFHRGNISSLVGNIGSNKCCLYLEAICIFKDSKFLDTLACTKCSVSPPSHINRFTVTPVTCPVTLCSASKVRQLITHTAILIILVTSETTSIRNGLDLPLWTWYRLQFFYLELLKKQSFNFTF